MEEINVYYTIEQEFNRLLTPMEKEIINDWLKTRKAETIIQAIKESVYNGVTNSLRYIDKILKTWEQEQQNQAQVSNVLDDDDSWLN